MNKSLMNWATTPFISLTNLEGIHSTRQGYLKSISINSKSMYLLPPQTTTNGQICLLG